MVGPLTVVPPTVAPLMVGPLMVAPRTVRLERALGRWKRKPRQLVSWVAVRKMRLYCQVGSPSRLDITISFDHGHNAALNRQCGLVLVACFVVVERRLIEVQKQWVVSEDQDDEEAQSEKLNPINFHALFYDWMWTCVLLVCLPRG